MTKTTPDENGCYQASGNYCLQNTDEGWTYTQSYYVCDMGKGYSNSDCTGSTISFTWE